MYPNAGGGQPHYHFDPFASSYPCSAQSQQQHEQYYPAPGTTATTAINFPGATNASYSAAFGDGLTAAASSSSIPPPPLPPTSAYQHQQQQQQQQRQQYRQPNGRGESLLAMRKHRSLEGAQFLVGHFDPYATSAGAVSSGSYNPASAELEMLGGYLPASQSAISGTAGRGVPPASAPPIRPNAAGASSAAAAAAAGYESQMLLTRAPADPGSRSAAGGAAVNNYSFPFMLAQHQQQQHQPTTAGNNGHHNLMMNPSTAAAFDVRGYSQQQQQQHQANALQHSPYVDTTNYGMMGSAAAAAGDGDDDLLSDAWAHHQPVSARTILQQTEFDPRALRREFAALCDRFNYLATSVRTFWAPELHRERHRRKELAFRAEQLEQRLQQMNLETQTLRLELDRRQHQDEAAGTALGRPHSHARDFTDHSITLHEWQTLKTKLERSELSLAERTRELQNAELRAKCAEEQKEEVERRNDILSRSNTANEAQLKLLHEDLNVLRGKLELKNQQLDSREKANKKLEAELDSVRLELKESQQNVQEYDRRTAQLTHRLDQLERELREQSALADQLKQRLAQQQSTRAEAELQQRLDQAQTDRQRLEQLIDQLRQQNDNERQQQLQQFLAEREQLQANIAYLNKELADRHMLISSQSEKISQLDSAVKNGSSSGQQQQPQFSTTTTSEEQQQQQQFGQQQHRPNGDGTTAGDSGRGGGGDGGSGEKPSAAADGSSREESELERTHREVDQLLKRVQRLERERAELLVRVANARREGGGGSAGGGGSFLPTNDDLETTADMSADERVNVLRQRIRDLEEALRESVECTAEREKALGEQKRLVEKLSSQVTELFESSGSAAAITSQHRQLREALGQLAEAQKQVEEERQQRLRQVSTVRKELGMALVAEKEAAIALVQQCCPGAVDVVPGLREKLDSLQKQKEALRHALLMSSASAGPFAEDNLQQQQQQQQQMIGGGGGTGGVGLASIQQQLAMMAMLGNGGPMTTTVAAANRAGVNADLLRSPAMVQPGRPLSAVPPLSQPIRIQTAGLQSAAGAGGTMTHNGLGISAPASLNFHQSGPGGGGGGFDEFGQVDEDGIWA